MQIKRKRKHSVDDMGKWTMYETGDMSLAGSVQNLAPPGSVSGNSDFQHPGSMTGGASNSPVSGAPSIGALSPQPTMLSSQMCAICGDRATGKHYNAYSCDGCKGFFRRSIRKKNSYTCRFSRHCVVDKDKRNQCRYCRLQKCFKVGMRQEAVQNERDRISNSRPSYEEVGGSNGNSLAAQLSVPTLLNAELTTRQLTTPMLATGMDLKQKKMATMSDICESMRQQLLMFVEWAKFLPSFADLGLDDQVSLLRAHAGEQLLLGLAHRSLPYLESDILVLGNDCIVSRHPNQSGSAGPGSGQDENFARMVGRILDEIVKPMKRANINDSEFACMRALVFFDPDSKGACNPDNIRNMRETVTMNLEDFIHDQQYTSRGRFGQLLLIIPNLHTITINLVEQIRIAKYNCTAVIDNLIQEMLLGVTPDLPPNFLHHHQLLASSGGHLSGSHMNGVSLEALTNGGTSSSNHTTSTSALLDSMSTMSPGGVGVDPSGDDGSMSLLQHSENINLGSAANNVMHDVSSPQMSNGGGDDEDIQLEQTAGLPHQHHHHHHHHHQSPGPSGSVGGGSASNSPLPYMMSPTATASSITLSGHRGGFVPIHPFKAERTA